MIIVEGPDGAGKTNLIRRLEKSLGLKPEPRVVSKDTEMMGDLMAWVEADLASWPRPALYDRHRLISEPIYGPVLRQNMQPGFDDQHWLQEMMLRFNAARPLVIYCLPPLAVVMANVRSGTDNVVVADQIEKIYWLYFMAAARDTHSMVWDYTSSIPAALGVIQHQAYLRTAAAADDMGAQR